VDDEIGMLEVCRDTLESLEDVAVQIESESTRAAELITREPFDLLISDVRMPGLSGVDLVRRAKEHDPTMAVLMLTAYPSVETAVACMKLGAADYVTKPFLPEDLTAKAQRLLAEKRLRAENRLLARHMERVPTSSAITAGSAAMQKLLETVDRCAETTADVLIVGETGTGKELVARRLHARSREGAGPFVPIDCGAIPDDLLESELFGHERGAFTGAHERRMGLMEFADRGTFFLDEVGELPQRLQAKLLRALQERRIRRVGGKEEIAVDVRLVTATSRDLDEAVRRGRFREDFFYRINVVRVDLPPLRDRPGDVALLFRHFVGRFAPGMGRGPVEVADEALELLECYRWPGNVRELQNVVKRTLALASGETISVDDLPDDIVEKAGKKPRGGFFDLREREVEAFEQRYFEDLLRECGGDVTAAAQRAEIPRGSLYRLLKKHGISANDYRD
jgi:DNA-binding NtrC family response regulator